jgi:hypothetical protein
MAQTRVVLDESDRPKAEAIMTQTGIKTFSQLLSILLINYGDHLVSALKATPTPPPPPVQMGRSQGQQGQGKPSIQPSMQSSPKPFKPMGGL